MSCNSRSKSRKQQRHPMSEQLISQWNSKFSHSIRWNVCGWMVWLLMSAFHKKSTLWVLKLESLFSPNFNTPLLWEPEDECNDYSWVNIFSATIYCAQWFHLFQRLSWTILQNMWSQLWEISEIIMFKLSKTLLWSLSFVTLKKINFRFLQVCKIWSLEKVGKEAKTNHIFEDTVLLNILILKWKLQIDLSLN